MARAAVVYCCRSSTDRAAPLQSFTLNAPSMANREELGIIRAARAGQAEAQLALGRLYLFGSAGLPLSLPTALHWLERAARQGSADACALIGAHIPFELARRSAVPLAPYYQRASDAGIDQAALVLAQLVLGDGADAAGAGLADAHALLARRRLAGDQEIKMPVDKEQGASAQVRQQFAMLDAAWMAGQHQLYLQAALPLARALALADENAGKAALLAPADVKLLSRCARALAGAASADEHELRRFRELAAAGQDRHAQMALGLWCARMQADGTRTAVGAGSANFKKAIRWLTLAGEQGLAEAWYALSRIYIKPEFSQRNVLDAHRYLERAAEMGYRDAQLECGHSAWRARRENETNDVRAVYWLQKAAAGGCPEAAATLRKIVPRGSDGAFSATAALAARADRDGYPLLSARLELAALFQLSRAEALLIDVRSADHGHCLVVDIRASYGRSKRRLVLVDTVQQRHALDRIVRLFDNVDCGPGGPEGNYRQRLYRLKTLGAGVGPAPRPRYDMAA
jgi:TPR repeat protein